MARKKNRFVAHKTIPWVQMKAEGDGTFEGWLSRYDEVDLGRDLVEKGAFTKTLQVNDGSVPLLWQHDDTQPIGTLELEDRDEGLWVKGALLIDGVSKASEAYALIKNKVIKGLSIGYRAVRKEMRDGVRRLKEIALYEGSIVTFAMLPSAEIQSVKGLEGSDFNSVLEQVQLMDGARQLLNSLGESLYRIMYDVEADADEKSESAAASIDEFRDAWTDFMPKWLGVKAVPKEIPLPPAAVETAKELVECLKAAIKDAESGSSESDAAGASQDAAPALEKDDADASEEKAVEEWLSRSKLSKLNKEAANA